MAFDAFISYSSRDKAAADATCAVLEGAGVRCWIAPRDIRTGMEYGAAIVDAIDNCLVMVLVFSSSANESRQIRREIERAVARGVPILPVRIEEVVPTESMAYFLGGIHWLDALNPPLEHHLQRLAETVKAMLTIDAARTKVGSTDVQRVPARGESEKRAPSVKNISPLAGLSHIARKPGRPWLLAVVVAAGLIAVVGSAWFYRLEFSLAPPSQFTTLRAAAESHDFLIGTAANTPSLRYDPIYSKTLAREYNLIIPEVETRFARLHPTRTDFTFDDADALVEFASAHDMKVYGQPLVWGGELPLWLTGANLNPAEVSAILKDFIHSTLRHFQGRIRYWDVVWSVFDDLGKMNGSFWLKTLGPDYVQKAFEWAHEADPQAKLFFREQIGFDPLGIHADATYELLRKFRASGTPIDGIAIGSAVLLDQMTNQHDAASNMARIAALGLQTFIVDFAVGVPLPANDQILQKQAEVYRDYLGTCLSTPGCKGFLTWGFDDKHVWSGRWPGMNVGASMPFDAEMHPKPAYKAMLDTFRGARSSSQ